jgi:caa(3)-type oxidase subunit IV
MSDAPAPVHGQSSHSSSPASHEAVTVTDPHAAHAHGHHEMHLKLYYGIGITLLALTGFTVFLSYVDFGSQQRNIVIALLVAAFKVSLVGAVFMHLKGEKATVWRFLYFTAFFVAGLFLLTYFHWADPVWGTTLNKH